MLNENLVPVVLSVKKDAKWKFGTSTINHPLFTKCSLGNSRSKLEVRIYEK